ncbi:MAG: hypothetical protein JSS98_07085 [Bacteroidetes bacterium]|nr:hypothetical protein [Bacteroidota bacterium]
MPKTIRHFFIFAALVLSGMIFFTACKKKDKTPPSNLAGMLTFQVKDITATFTIDENLKKIFNSDSLPFQTDVSKLVAIFTLVPNATVKVGGVVQASGSTINNFTSPLIYSVVAQDGSSTRDYTVSVNVAKIDPKTISWQQLTPDAGWGNFHSVEATALNNKFYMLGGTMGYFGAFPFTSTTSTDGAAWTRTRAVDNNGDSVPRAEHPAFISFNNKLWILGGHRPGVGFAFDDVSNGVWSSSDGLAWTVSVPAVATDRWSKRERIGAVVFNNKLFVIGGNGYPAFGNTNSPSAAYNDVWSSSDGTTWTVVNANPAFLARTNPAVFVYKNKIWLAGGKDNGGNLLNDVWNSADGNSWTKVTTTSSFTGRWGHQIIADNNQLVLVGGEDATGVSSDVWVSENDGVAWTKITTGDVRALPANFKGRRDFSMVVQNGSVYIIGGLGAKDAGTGNYTFTNDVWKGTFH